MTMGRGAQTIERHMATTADGRQVHYRRAGGGMPVLLLHQSPMSSAEFEELIAELAARYLVIAPDTPGNGLSDPLPGPLEQAAMAEYADALAAFMDALGLRQAALYGFHTGALCVLEFVRRHPGRVIVAVANGYIDNPPAMREELATNYLSPVEPEWSGGHLHWWWMRLREQYSFFPWYRRESACRTGYDTPEPDAMHTTMMEILRAGSHYQRPYRAAFTYDSLPAVQSATVPLTVMVDRTDLLYPFLDQIVDPAACVDIRRPETPKEAIDVLKDVLARHATDASDPPADGLEAAATGPVAGRVWRRFVTTDVGRLYVRLNDEADGPPILFVPDALESGARWQPVMQALVGHRRTIAIDPPGAGESADWLGDQSALTVQADGLASALDALGVEEVDIVSRARGAALALTLAQRLGRRARRLAVGRPIAVGSSPEYPLDAMPPIAIDALGTHFTVVWNMLRDQELYAPWFLRDAAHAITSVEPDIAPEVIHQRTVDFFKSLHRHREITAASASFDLRAAVKRLSRPLTWIDCAPAKPVTLAARVEGALDRDPPAAATA